MQLDNGILQQHFTMISFKLARARLHSFILVFSESPEREKDIVEVLHSRHHIVKQRKGMAD